MSNASEILADTLVHGGTIYTFGTGHSHLLAEEIFYRAGGLVKVHPILDEPLMLHVSASRSSQMERLPGYAELLINQHLGIKPNDTLIIFSNSGRNTVPIDMAMLAKGKGMRVIGLVNLRHSQNVSSRHPSGKRLFEVCDVVLDNGGCIGDASVPIGDYTVGPTSTTVGAAILQASVCGTVAAMLKKGIQPEIFCSGNIDGGDEKNKAYIDKYADQIPML